MPIIRGGVILDHGSCSDIAREFDVHPRHVSYVAAGIREGAPALVAKIQKTAKEQRGRPIPNKKRRQYDSR